jgi:hypothetical protein
MISSSYCWTSKVNATKGLIGEREAYFITLQEMVPDLTEGVRDRSLWALETLPQAPQP